MQLLWTRELSRRLGRSGITANCVHPGVVGNDVFRDYPRWFNALMSRCISKTEVGASPVVYLATSPRLAGVTGECFCKKERRPLSGPAAADGLGHRVWEYGTTLAAVRPGVD
jgi:NAD(P)-dependent dehydrogenase (short-subunit alcohol dehydrogenase family)